MPTELSSNVYVSHFKIVSIPSKYSPRPKTAVGALPAAAAIVKPLTSKSVVYLGKKSNYQLLSAILSQYLNGDS